MEDDGGRPDAARSAAAAMEAVTEEIAAISVFPGVYRKQFCNLSRRIRLLSPMFEELRESRRPVSDESAACSLAALASAVSAARDLLLAGSRGSRIRLVLEREKIMKNFQEVSGQLERALGQISFDKLDISDEVKEQVELVHTQFRRSKERVDASDVELYNDVSSMYNISEDTNIDQAILMKLAEKLQLTTINDLKLESLALHKMVVASGDVEPGKNIEKMSMLLRKIKDFVQTQNPEMAYPGGPKSSPCGKPNACIIPDDFRCPISLDLMKDPVIVSTGQTYERVCIQKWLNAGHVTCPKTQQKLSNTTLIPNYVLRSLIARWCESNGMEPPNRPMCSSKLSPPTEHAKIDALVRKLSSSNIEDLRLAAGELRLLAKRCVRDRIYIGIAGAVPLLVGLLSTPDSKAQEHAVTALLNLSIYDENKRIITSSGAIPAIIHVLKKGSMEARENAAATLFSLSVIDENKVTIGASGAIPALVFLLSEGNQRGKKDAATALFNLCIYQGNKGKAVRAGLVPVLMELLTEPVGVMVDEALAILAILSSHPEGKTAIGIAEAIPILVDVIRRGSPRNRENAAAVLAYLCAGEQQYQHLAEAQECLVMGPLLELAQNGTDRGKRKAVLLLNRMNRFLEQQKYAQD